ERDRTLFLNALIAYGGLDPNATEDVTEIVIASNRYLANGSSLIVMAQLDDILGERTPVNVPGTSTEYPNWRRKLSADLDTITNDARFHRLCTALRTTRPRARNEA
ncbi:MAG TPA: 4-alpha-glucanotransferase, partial [Candidatus Acidoferrum sp.]|nr:4-alpha-glucanotransferase [Candidatus Acidoferrum sp.]